jgi:hypothetical protein
LAYSLLQHLCKVKTMNKFLQPNYVQFSWRKWLTKMCLIHTILYFFNMKFLLHFLHLLLPLLCNPFSKKELSSNKLFAVCKRQSRGK